MASLCEGTTYGHMLSTVPPIAERILTHLPMKSLNTSAQVCKLWAETVRIVKRRRHKLSWMFWESRRKKSKNEVEEQIDDVFSKASSEPKIALLFATNAFMDNQLSFVRSHVDSDNALVDRLNEALPTRCLFLGTSTDGIIGASVKGDKVIEAENKAAFSCLLLPNLPNTDFYPFVIKDIEDLNLSKTKERLSDSELFYVTGIPFDKVVKAAIIFSTGDSSAGITARLVASTLHGRNPKVAIGGGCVDALMAPKDMLSEHVYLPHTQGIAFCGENLQTASVVIKSSVKNGDGVEKVLMTIKDSGISEENSFAFMFACVGRGEGFHGVRNVEADVFNKLFPNTPLFGFFGNGELGFTSLPNKKDEVAETPKLFSSTRTATRKLPTFLHSYTTIIVFIANPSNNLGRK